ncbi:MAG: protein-glutamate O-methyltransferase family protein [Anaerolineae bacterium]|nr:protein-glutamate O-methyltransferase family protein [Anaerolineae bacterium]
MPGRPPPIRTDTSNAFARRTIQVRVPAIIRETQRLNPDYAPPIQQALDRLHDALVSDAPIPMLDLPAPDYDDWLAAWTTHNGETWQATEWFFAEIFTYRLLIEAVHWWETARDPFAPKKVEDYEGAQLWDLLGSALAVEGSPEQVLSDMIEFALWGNRIDLSYALAASHGQQRADGDLLVDERGPVIEHLLRQRGVVHLITDNAGSELALDLALSDRLLADHLADQVVLHLKLHPTFVSDAIVPDVLHFLDLAQAHDSTSAAFSGRLRDDLEQGRLRLAPDGYWNSTRFLWDLPPRLTTLFSGGRLAITKGDANYRRMVGDAVWPPETPLAQATSWFPCPLLALRTLKSDAVVGLPPGLADQLDAIDDQWRVNGRRGVLQTNLEKT